MDRKALRRELGWDLVQAERRIQDVALSRYPPPNPASDQEGCTFPNSDRNADTVLREGIGRNSRKRGGK